MLANILCLLNTYLRCTLLNLIMSSGHSSEKLAVLHQYIICYRINSYIGASGKYLLLMNGGSHLVDENMRLWI